MSSAIDAAKGIVAGAQSWLQLEDDEPDYVQYGTRDHGDVGNEEPSATDYREARRLAALVTDTLGEQVRITVEPVDEWITLRIEARNG